MNRNTRNIILPLLLLLSLLAGQLFAQQQIARDNWPQFRGVQASGVAHAPNLPVHWNGATGHNIAWRTPIPGLGLSSPVIWGDKVFITTAVGEGHQDDIPGLRVGRYGDIDPVNEDYPHLFQVLCLDRSSGKMLWRETAHKGVPQVKRHTKSSHASTTVATDGRHVIAFFGSEGLYCYDMAGKQIWKKDLGFLNSAFFAVPTAQWGFASSPVLHKNRVVVQCDVLDQSFVAVFDADTGDEIWRTLREEQPTWCTPTVATVNGRDQIILNGWHRRAAYDFETGAEIWFMDNGGDIPTPTPIIAHGMSFFSSSHGRVRPLYAIKLEAQGDITLKRGELSNDFVTWSNPRRGAYMPTPIIVDDILYVGNDSGILTTYEAKTGKEIYRQRLGSVRAAYTASPVSNQKYLYFPNDDGTVHVVKSGATYEYIGANALGEAMLTSPAIAGDMLFIRTANALYGIKENGNEADTASEVKAGTAAPEETTAMPELPASQLSDPTEIFKITNAVTEATHTITYTLQFEGTGSLAERSPKGTVQVTASGWGEFTADKFTFNAEVVLPGSTEPMPIVAGSNGDKFYLVNDTEKTLHADYEFGVMGRSAGMVYAGLIREFFMEKDPFTDEVNAENKELIGVSNVMGEPCYEIKVSFTSAAQQVATYWISTKDYTLRKRSTLRNQRDGSRGGQVTTLSQLKVNPTLRSGYFALPEHEGYTTVTTAPQQ